MPFNTATTQNKGLELQKWLWKVYPSQIASVSDTELIKLLRNECNDGHTMINLVQRNTRHDNH